MYRVGGFSDPTGLLFPITTKYDIATIYGNNFGEYGAEEYDRSVNENLEILQGNLIEQKNYELKVPIIYDTDVSHKGPCLTIINGAMATVKCENGSGSIGFELIV